MIQNKLNVPLITSIINSLFLPELELVRVKLNNRIKKLKEHKRILEHKKRKLNIKK